MSKDRRPLGQPEFSEPTTDRPATDRRPLPPIDRALFLPPPGTEPPTPTTARPPAADALPFSSNH